VEALWGADTGACDVELAMGEAVGPEVNAGKFQRLPLGFVDRHGEADPQWKLEAFKCEGIVGWN